MTDEVKKPRGRPKKSTIIVRKDPQEETFEYRVIAIDTGTNAGASYRMDIVNAQAVQGWQLVAVEVVYVQTYLYFERVYRGQQDAR